MAQFAITERGQAALAASWPRGACAPWVGAEARTRWDRERLADQVCQRITADLERRAAR